MYSIKLKELRENHELSIHDISLLLNFEKDTYGKYEREYILIPVKHLNSLANYFNVSFDYLFDFTDLLKYENINEEIDLNLMAQRLKELRKENNLTQEKLAEQLNVVKGTIGNYESARAIIATPFLFDICKKYKISADYLLGKIGEPKYLK